MPYGYGSANRRGPSGPAGGASAGGNYGGNRNPQQTYGGRSTPVTTGGPPSVLNPPTKKTTPVTTGGPPSVLNPQPFNYGKFRKNTAKNTLWNKWQRHKMMSNLMKEGKVKDYHQLGAHDFTQRFDVPDWLSKGLATGYQYGSELARQIIPVNKKNIYTALGEGIKSGEPLGAIVGSISDALSRAKEESRLGHLGIEGLTVPQQEIYNQYAKIFNPTLKELYKAKGGIVDLYKYGGYLG
tara:strand:+ start:39 stop:755 length:717 start_codon:yes stop_codon:yes gene_type:complete